jgi:BirA family biotin operon repressor/biotin-[acetyl-CoA-carboxylase] ligase
VEAEIDVERAQAALDKRWRLVYRREVDSTMTLARELAAAGAAEGTVALADAQRAGRGRMGRTWISQGGVNLYLTAIVCPPLAALRQLAMIAPLAVAEGVEAACGLRAEVKWPNDVQLAGLKVSGVLIDAEVRGDQPALAFVGIGINVNLDPAGTPELRDVATSLRAQLGHPLPREDVLVAVLSRFGQLLDESERGGSVRERWRARLNTLGKRVSLRAGDTVVTGLALDVSEDGGLILEQSDGSCAVFTAGEVTLRV